MASTKVAVSKALLRKGTVLRGMRLLAFMPLAGRVPAYSRLIWSLLRDSRVPASQKAILAAAAGYLIVGRELIPDNIPVLGQLDELVVVILAVEVFLDGIPEEILDEKIEELGIDREAFEHDMEQVRRLTPAPVRKFVRRLPGAFEATGRFVKESGIGPKVKSWVTDVRLSRLSKEEISA
jgi:uncharacterized membrane protein YkvA (DUF1232 family)